MEGDASSPVSFRYQDGEGDSVGTYTDSVLAPSADPGRLSQAEEHVSRLVEGVDLVTRRAEWMMCGGHGYGIDVRA